MDLTWITAHSGADGTPDNSLEFVRYALETDADALEIDIRRRTDGVLVLAHDCAEASSPTLRDVFRMLSASDKMVNCDLKEPGLERAVLQLAAETGVLGQLVFSGTVDPNKIDDAAFRRERVFWNIEEQLPGLYERCRADVAYLEIAAAQMCALCRHAGIRTINIAWQLASASVQRIAAQHGISLSVWTVNEPAVLRDLLGRGVRNVTTRKLRAALELRKGGAGK